LSPLSLHDALPICPVSVLSEKSRTVSSRFFDSNSSLSNWRMRRSRRAPSSQSEIRLGNDRSMVVRMPPMKAAAKMMASELSISKDRNMTVTVSVFWRKKTTDRAPMMAPRMRKINMIDRLDGVLLFNGVLSPIGIDGTTHQDQLHDAPDQYPVDGHGQERAPFNDTAADGIVAED